MVQIYFILYLEVILPSKVQFMEGDNTIGKNFKKGLVTKNQDITIYDSLEAFRTEEKLEKANSWYCSTCKSHQEAYKKLEIFRAPNILIIQLVYSDYQNHMDLQVLEQHL